MSIGEEVLGRTNFAGAAPVLNLPLCCRPDRHVALLASLAVQPDGAVVDLAGLQPEDLRNTPASVVEQREEQMVAPTNGGGLIGSGEDGIDLHATHEAEHRLHRAFARDREDALSRFEEVGRLLGDRKAGEGVDRREPRVAGADRVTSSLLQMLPEREDRLRREPVEGQLVDGKFTLRFSGS